MAVLDSMPPPSENTADGIPFPVVGVGASAGGLEAFLEMLEAFPAKPGLSLLFVQHLEPGHKSQLAEILGKATSMTVQEAVDGTAIQVDNVYVIPPNKSLALVDGSLKLGPRPARGPHMPVDYLFRSLAQVQGSRSVGVILSGGGTDGTLGFLDIKAEGGITLAQDEKTARHDSMPRSAVAEGAVDYLLSPSQIARELLRIAGHSYVRQSAAAVDSGAGTDFVNEIIGLLRARSDVDFTHYKRTTIRRRIQRRMALRGVEDPAQYLRLLREEPAELHNLYQDFLIRVTQFFRDPEAFEALKERVFPALVEGRTPERPIRIWVAGCASGEEVYSLAIALQEFLSGREENLPIKILATDLNETALEKARAGSYIDNIELDVSPERLRRFFVRVNGHYQISKAIRDLCVFSRHNMASDPPFSNLDLVSCRNVLIYMDGTLQKRVLPVLHYALKPEGFLLLGSSESVGQFGERFQALDGKNRLFRKRAAAPGTSFDFHRHAGTEGAARPAGREEQRPLWSALDVQREADRIVLGRYAPVGVVIDESMTVMQFRGKTSSYLEPAPGMASLDLLRMLREGLLAEVRGAFHQARTENVPVVRDGLPLLEQGQTRHVRVDVIPFKVPPSGIRFFLVLFQDLEAGGKEAPATVESQASSSDPHVVQLQQELSALREYLQSVIEEQESTNEELKSANEEILSANEELQSTNEELQTAKEESQSANEELATVNDELRHRNAELARVNNDLMNLLTGVNIPIVMVSRDLRIRRFTPLAEKSFNLIPTDMGRPIGDIKSNLRVEDLVGRIEKVIDTLTPQESEVRDREGRWHLLRVRPYVTLENKIDGASIVLLDIDSIKRALERLRDGDGGAPFAAEKGAQEAPEKPGSADGDS